MPIFPPQILPMVQTEVLTQYQTVIGLEIHIQLALSSKMFATEPSTFSPDANQQLSVITFAHPGALPSINREAISSAIKLGCATQCTINRNTYFARKNYFYPDLPKGYQISQDVRPICEHGLMSIQTANDEKKDIHITRIHIEEDAGKSIHDQSDSHSQIDLNRAGVCLLELVTEPDLRSAEEAVNLFTEMRKLVRFLGICEGNMEQGNLRCDANVSVKHKEATELGTRVEIKNLNSFQALYKAVTYESERQINELEKGNKVFLETRSWDPIQQKTIILRRKETADDYRYFPDPDLLPVYIKEKELSKIKDELPVLPQVLYDIYKNEYKLPENEASALVENKELSDYFELLRTLTEDEKVAANWVLGPIKTYLNEEAIAIADFPLAPASITSLIQLIKSEKISYDSAKKQIFPKMLKEPDKEPLAIATSLGVLMESQLDNLESAMNSLMDQHPKEVKRYKNGKKGLKGFFVGKLMQEFKGKANPKEVNIVVQQKLDS